MTDWTMGMQQRYLYTEVSPDSWRDRRVLDTVSSCSVTRDASTDKLESAEMAIDEPMDDESFVRVYLVATQDGREERVPLGTFLAQQASVALDGKVAEGTLTCMSPLEELDVLVPLGYTVRKGTDCLKAAHTIVSNHCRAPIAEPSSGLTLADDWVADDSDTWLTVAKALLSMASHHIEVDAMGRLSIAPDVPVASRAPVWTYADDNSSIMLPDVTLTNDWYGLPNTCEVIVSTDAGTIVGRAVNDSIDSKLSTVSRGREILMRVTDVDAASCPDQESADRRALTELKKASCIERTATIKHGWNGVRLHDGVALDYSRHGVSVPRAEVTRQEFVCGTGLIVTEEVRYTEQLW